ncbi:helix-turn-helix domain-containing protein [Streptomyces sp. NPDC088341]|uniref:helix-turn-helix domain-containing protein n=1 Tax=Streptomyces sp. NPDC088341 TaxID=3154870 RepID=UPI003429768B
MAVQQLSAPSCAQSGIPASGVRHVRHRHTERFTVVGNHLAQHRGLSLTAIGLAVHIQSLSDGAKIGIKALTARFAEGEVVIARALRELEACGYLSRTKERTPGDRWVTRTVAYDDPSAVAPVSSPAPQSTPKPRRRPESAGSEPTPPKPAPVPAFVPDRAPAPALPEPDHPDLARHRTATEILAGLRRDAPSLVLSERDVRRLAPAVSVWLERGVEPAAVCRTLTAALPPDPINHPAALLAHRLTELLPPPLPTEPTARPVPRIVPLQNCDRCDHAFRAPEPGNCPGCSLLPGS